MAVAISCPTCKRRFKVDPDAPAAVCPRCKATVDADDRDAYQGPEPEVKTVRVRMPGIVVLAAWVVVMLGGPVLLALFFQTLGTIFAPRGG